MRIRIPHPRLRIHRQRARKPKVLFLYLTKWSGHSAIASAIHAAINLKDPNVNVVESDFVSERFPWLLHFFKKSYVAVMKHLPRFWKYLYDNPRVEEATSEIRELFDMSQGGWLRKKVLKERADIIVCTQALPCEVVAAQKAYGKINVPLVAVPTDFVANIYWIHNEVDQYLVPSKEVAEDVKRRGIPKAKIIVTGMPVHPRFLKPVPKAKARQFFGLKPDLPTLLFIGGSYGFGDFETALADLARSELKIQAIVATARNIDLYRLLKKRWACHPQFKILGYTSEIPLCMDAADMLVGKPGGATATEALAKGLPMAVFFPFPGQEEFNTKYLVKHKAAIVIHNVEELVPKITKFFSDSKKLNEMKRNAKKIGKPNAAFDAADIILRMLEERKINYGASV